MDINLLNVFGKNYNGGKIKFIKEKTKLLFFSGELIISFDILKKKIESFDFGIKSFVTTFDIQDNEKMAIILFENSCAILFDFKNKNIKGKIVFKNQYLSVKWSPKGKFFAISSTSLIQIWKVQSYKKKEFFDFFLTYTFDVICSEIWGFEWDREGKNLITGSTDGIIRIFRLKNKIKLKANLFLKNCDEINLVKFTPEKREFWLLSRKNILKKYRFSFKNIHVILKDLKKYPFFFCFRSFKLRKETGLLTASEINTESGFVIQGYKSGILVIFEIPLIEKKSIKNTNFKRVYPISLFPYRKFDFFNIEISSLSASKDLNFIIIGSYKQKKIFVIKRLKPITLLSNNEKEGNFTSLSLSYNDKLICTGSSKGFLRIWSTNLGVSLLYFRNHSEKISGAIFLKKTSRFILSCSLDGTFKLFDLKKFAIVKIIENLKNGDKFDYFDINYSNKLIISSSAVNYNIFIWSLKTSSLKEIIQNSNFKISGLQFLEKRNKIISYNVSGIFKLWILDFFQNIPLKISCKTVYMNTEILALSLSPVFKELVFFSNLGQIVVLNSSTFKLIGKLNCRSKKFSRNNLKDIDCNRNVLIKYSKNGKYIFLITEKKNTLILRANIKNVDTYLNKKSSDLINKVGIIFYPKYLKKFSSNEKIYEKHYIIDFKGFYSSRKWLFLFKDGMFIIGMNKNKTKIRFSYPMNIFGKNENYLLRISQKLFFEKNYFLFKFLLYYFPLKFKIKLCSLILTNSILKHAFEISE